MKTQETNEPILSLEWAEKLSKDVKQAAATMNLTDVRIAIDMYYQAQRDRIRAGNQARAHSQTGDPHAVVDYLSNNLHIMEGEIKKVLQAYVENQRAGVWLKSITGIGPVLAAGLLTYISPVNRDGTPKEYAGHIYSFAGLNPNIVWEAGQKRPYSVSFKTLCYKIGESFVKFQNHKKDHYGQYYARRKRLEWQRNLAGDFAGQANAKKTSVGQTTDAYGWYSGAYDPVLVQWCLTKVAPTNTNDEDAGHDTDEAKTADDKGSRFLTIADAQAIFAKQTNGAKLLKAEEKLLEAGLEGFREYQFQGVPMLPPAHIHARSRRVAVKLFLSHAFEIMYRLHWGVLPPEGYAQAVLKHGNYIPPPNLHLLGW